MGAGTAQGGACLLISGNVRKNMEFVVFAGVLLLLFIFMIVQELIQTKNQEKLFKKYLRENYGKEPPKEYSLERFARLGSYLERHKEEKQLDDITWNDLGMDEVFRRIDRTYSAAGEEYLYYTLRNISCGREALEHLEEVVNWLQEQENIKVRIQLLMKRLGHLGKYSLYDYLDNRKLIIDYLTERVFKMVEKTGDSKKYRRPYCGFWKALRSTRCLDMKMTPDEVKLVRNYNRKLSVESMKKRVIGSAVTLGIYMRGINEDSPLQDCFEALLRMNDNDIMEAQRYKQKKLRQFNEDELSGVFVSSEKHRFRLLDESDGTLYDYDSINNLDLQGGNSLDHPTAP